MASVNNPQNQANYHWIEKIILGIVFVAVGTLIIVVFSSYRPVLKGRADTIGRILLFLILFSIALITKQDSHLKQYWLLFWGLFILMLTISVDYWAAGLLQKVFKLPTDTPSALAFEKIKSASIAALVVLPLTKLSGESLGSIYVQMGRLLISLIIGFAAFSIASAGAIPTSQLFFSGKTVEFSLIISWLPWILLFVLCNAFFEELLFRGLFLRKLEPFFGKFVSNGLIVLVFTGLHLGVTYTKDQLLFLVLLIPLAFLWGYIMQKTESIWGSVLFHAGMDLPIVVALFSNL